MVGMKAIWMKMYLPGKSFFSDLHEVSRQKPVLDRNKKKTIIIQFSGWSGQQTMFRQAKEKIFLNLDLQVLQLWVTSQWSPHQLSSFYSYSTPPQSLGISWLYVPDSIAIIDGTTSCSCFLMLTSLYRFIQAFSMIGTAVRRTIILFRVFCRQNTHPFTSSVSVSSDIISKVRWSEIAALFYTQTFLFHSYFLYLANAIAFNYFIMCLQSTWNSFTTFVVRAIKICDSLKQSVQKYSCVCDTAHIQILQKRYFHSVVVD